MRSTAVSGRGLHVSVEAKSAMGAWTVTTGGTSVLRSVKILVSVTATSVEKRVCSEGGGLAMM